MKFITRFDWKADAQVRAEGISRFQKTGGLPPEGVKLLGRWTRADLSGGFVLLETDDPKKLTEFSYMWSDLMELSTTPVIEDEDMQAVLHAVVK